MAEDFYTILGVSRSASAEEIRRAYKKLSSQHHPDRNPDNKAALEKYKLVQQAYSVLKDPEKRKKYDQFGENWERYQQPDPQAGPHNWSWSSSGPGSGPIDLGDLFGGGVSLEEILGGGPRRPHAPQKGQDIRVSIEVPFYTAAEGGEHDVRLDRGGKTERLTVKIPAGIADGKTIRLGGQGHPGPAGGSSGDLLLDVKVGPHPFFKREGNNLVLELPISPSEAALGEKVEVPTLAEGKVVLSVPPGSNSGRKLRMRGKGIPDAKTKDRGDLMVVLKIVVPEELSQESRSLFEQLRASQPFDPRAGLW